MLTQTRIIARIYLSPFGKSAPRHTGPAQPVRVFSKPDYRNLLAGVDFAVEWAEARTVVGPQRCYGACVGTGGGYESEEDRPRFVPNSRSNSQGRHVGFPRREVLETGRAAELWRSTA